jgi:hypothetical protein
MKIRASLYLRMITLVLTLVIISTVAFAKEGIITKQEIAEAQKTWGHGVVAIGEVYTNGGGYRKVAEDHVDSLYAYQLGPVLFCPTKAAKKQFRTTKEGAVSYFVGGDKNFPEDKGFALQPWTKVRFENAGTFIHGDYAVAMGNYFFTPKEGEEVKVEYTFGYIKGKDGKLRINLHHSSLPYTKK